MFVWKDSPLCIGSVLGIETKYVIALTIPNVGAAAEVMEGAQDQGMTIVAVTRKDQNLHRIDLFT